jgi:hypothetical protein
LMASAHGSRRKISTLMKLNTAEAERAQFR